MAERLHFHFSFSCIGEGNGNPLQCSCLENPRDGKVWWAAVYGATQSQTRLTRLSSSSRSSSTITIILLEMRNQELGGFSPLNRLPAFALKQFKYAYLYLLLLFAFQLSQGYLGESEIDCVSKKGNNIQVPNILKCVFVIFPLVYSDDNFISDSINECDE